MPSIRVGFSSDLNITGGNTGIGTATPTARLEVSNGIVAERAAGSGGISTFKEYQGFNQTLATLPHEIVTEEGVFSSLTGEIKITGETTVSSGSTVEVGKTKTLTVTDRFAVPLGETNNRDNAPEAGTTRFNQDFGTLEFFDGVNWKTVNSYSRGGAAGRGVFGGGGLTPNNVATIQFVNISSTGNAQYFGDLDSAKYAAAGASSNIRGLFAGGNPVTNVIQYITIASSGNAINFGDLLDSSGKERMGGAASSTRAVFAGGRTPTQLNEIDYVEIGTVGDALDFGDLGSTYRNQGACSSTTRGFFVGGGYDPVGQLSMMDYITFASKGNSVEFGNLTQRKSGPAGCSNATRGVFGGGLIFVSPTNLSVSTIEYISLQSLGNATNFGNLIESLDSQGASSNQIRGVFAGGYGRSPNPNTGDRKTIQYVTIPTTGNALDFGELSVGGLSPAGLSDSHGGLGGF